MPKKKREETDEQLAHLCHGPGPFGKSLAIKMCWHWYELAWALGWHDGIQCKYPIKIVKNPFEENWSCLP